MSKCIHSNTQQFPSNCVNMRSIFFLLLSALFLLPFVAFSSTFTSDNPIVLPTSTINDNGMPVSELPEVLDMNGEAVEAGARYHIVSPFWGAGGGGVYLTHLKNSDSKCPNGVVQHALDTEEGMPVKFIPSYPDPTPFNVVRETNDLNIMFSGIPTTTLCVNQTVWKVADPDITARWLRFVVTGGSIGNPGPETINNWFQIEKITGTLLPMYKLRYCPSDFVCETCDVECNDVGLTIHNGYRRLFLTDDEPFMVVFKKV